MLLVIETDKKCTKVKKKEVKTFSKREKERQKKREKEKIGRNFYPFFFFVI
jgi:hypothetical protein